MRKYFPENYGKSDENVIKYVKHINSQFNNLIVLQMEVAENGEEVSKEQFVSNVMKQIRMFLALKYCKTDNTPSEVVPGLFIGSIGAAMSKSKLKEVGITHILCVADSISPGFPEDFEYKIVKVLDSPDVEITRFLPECFDFINAALISGKILVHW